MMGGFDHHVSIGEDWMFPIPSPRFLASVLKDDDPVENIDSNRVHFLGHEDLNNGKNGARAAENVDEFPKTRKGGGLLERIAARAGFNAPRLNTESIRPSDLSISQDVRSPYLTIPPGLSPTTLLESPVFLSNSLVQPSPTTGKFLFASSGSNNKNCSFSAMASDNNKDQFFEDIDSQPFSFKPVADSGSALFNGDKNRLEPLSYHRLQSFYGIEKPLQPQNGVAFRNPMEFWRPSSENDPANNSIMPETNTTAVAGQHQEEVVELRSGGVAQNGVAFRNPMEFWRPSSENDPANNSIMPETNTTAVAGQHQEEDVELRSGGVDEDGYDWRKYGHKQVKGSEYPRTYYKCAHLNCTVKKKVERSHEGVVTEIIYKGSHNHPEPLVTAPNHRSAVTLDDQNSRMQPVRDGDSPWSMVQNRTVDGNWKTEESLEANCLQAQKCAHLDSSIAVDRSPALSNDEDEDDHQEESELKRRKMEAYTTEMPAPPTRAIREPRVVVQTTSEVDILDDGYRWRKYGQKVVKGNPNPRSYYKCTSASCTVRKHVERASHDLGSVITTYEGKHNHDVPAARNSSHLSSANSAAGGSHHHLHRTDPSQVQNEIPRFDNRAAAAPLSSYGLDGRQQMMGHHGFAYGSMNQTGMSLGSGIMGSQGKMMPSLPMAYMGGQQQSQMRLMMMSKAKGDPKLEPISDQSINIKNNNIGNNGSSVYHQIMNRLPPPPPPHGGQRQQM